MFRRHVPIVRFYFIIITNPTGEGKIPEVPTTPHGQFIYKKNVLRRDSKNMLKKGRKNWLFEGLRPRKAPKSVLRISGHVETPTRLANVFTG
jgi:hypothetical protein